MIASATIKNPQTFNRYSYVLNSPYKFTDPLGLIYWETSGACGSTCPGVEYGSGGGGGGITGGLEWAWGLDVADRQTTQQAQPPPPASGDGVVEASDIKPTVAPIDRAQIADVSDGAVFDAKFNPELTKLTTAVAQTAEQLKMASMMNADLALEQSKATVQAADAQHWEVRNLFDPFVDRNYGSKTGDGYVVLPNPGGESWSGSEYQTTNNIGAQAQTRANQQNAELQLMQGPNSTARQAFVKAVSDTVNISMTLTRTATSPGAPGPGGRQSFKLYLSPKISAQLYDQAVRTGISTAISRYNKSQ